MERACLPGNSDARVEVVELRRSQRNVFVLVFVGQLNLKLRQLILESLHRFLLLLSNPVKMSTNKRDSSDAF